MPPQPPTPTLSSSASATTPIPTGTAANFAAFYEPSWGRHKARTRPVPGNHDYHVAGAADYLEYFCPSAASCSFPGGTQQLYYSYDLGNWHIVALNSEADTAAGSAQLQWLQADLAAHPTSCLLAYWHQPLFSSGTTHGGNSAVRPFWTALYAARADVVLNGHEHNYERFAKQSPAGVADSQGIREFVVGTGGAGTGSYTFGSPVANSEVRHSAGNFWGVLKLALRDGGYDWTFVPAQGTTFTDSGSGTCNK
jgi:3',5'-cyclic AMP phosphodiesterase CpdA